MAGTLLRQLMRVTELIQLAKCVIVQKIDIGNLNDLIHFPINLFLVLDNAGFLVCVPVRERKDDRR